MREALRDSAPLFVSNASAMIIGSANSVVLGIVATPTQVAYFGSAERFSNAVRGVMRGVVDVMLPRMTQKGPEAARLQRIIMGGVVGVYGLAGITLILVGPWFVPWYLGEELRPASTVMQLLGVALLPFGITSALMLRATARHRFGQVARLALIGAAVHVVVLLPAGWVWGATGAAGAVIVSESLVALLYLVDLLATRRRASPPAPH